MEFRPCFGGLTFKKLHHPGLGPRLVERYGIPDLTSGVEQGLNGLCYRNEQVRKRKTWEWVGWVLRKSRNRGVMLFLDMFRGVGERFFIGMEWDHLGAEKAVILRGIFFLGG